MNLTSEIPSPLIIDLRSQADQFCEVASLDAATCQALADNDAALLSAQGGHDYVAAGFCMFAVLILLIVIKLIRN